MTRVDEFDSFYRATVRSVLVATYAATTDRRVAQDATVDAYRRLWRTWSRQRGSNPLGFTRSEAWRQVALNRGTHPLRRRRERDSDLELLSALSDLDSDGRRLVVLMTIGDLDLDEAAHEVDVDDELALELASRSFTQLETRIGTTLDDVVARLRALREITDELEMPDPATIRIEARRKAARNTTVLLVATVAAILVGGLLAANGEPAARQETMPYREKIGAESPDIVLDSHNLGSNDLLSLDEVSRLRPSSSWQVEDTDNDITNTTPYATCPTRRFADPDPLKVFVRAYTSSDDDRVAQSIEVSRSASASRAAYRDLVGFYANCEHPRVRLYDAYTVKRPFGDFQILRLQSFRDPSRFISVGFAQSGAVTSTVVHESSGTKPTDVDTFARTLNDSIARVCEISGGNCSDDVEVLEASLPATSQNPGFLNVVDLPPVDDIDAIWSASKPQTTEPNPAATPCDKATFVGDGFTSTQSRLFTIPDASQLPTGFAIAQTTATMTSEDAVKDFVTTLSATVSECPDSDLPIKVDQKKKISGDGFRGNVWRIGFEVEKDTYLYYRMGIVRRGATVSQVLFPPAGEYALSAKDFNALVERAGERLQFLDSATN